MEANLSTSGHMVRESRHFKVSADQLRRIHGKFAKRGEALAAESRIQIIYERADSSFVRNASLDQLLDEPNYGEKRITDVRFRLWTLEAGSAKTDPESEDIVAGLNFSPGSENRLVFFAEGDDSDWAAGFTREIRDSISEVRKPTFWQRVGKADIEWVVMAIAAGLLLMFWGWSDWAESNRELRSALADIEPFEGDMPEATKLDILLVRMRVMEQLIAPPQFGWGLFWLVAGVVGLVARYNPIAAVARHLGRSCFYWGGGKVEEDRREKLAGRIKWGVLAGFGVSVLATLVTSCMT